MPVVKKISAQELNRLRLLFDKYKNEDDKIPSSKLVDILRDEGIKDPHKEAKEIIGELDANSDGVISYAEFLKAFVQQDDTVDHFLEGIVEAKHIHPVTFTFHAPAYVHEVKVAGSFNDWKGDLMTPGDNHTFTKQLNLHDGRIHYKYILKIGDHWRWEVDHTKPTEHCHSGHVNNWVEVPEVKHG